MAFTCPGCGGSHFNQKNVCIKCGSFISQLPNGTLLINRYEIRKSIKAGGMGAIYLAFDIYDEKICAVKQMFMYEENKEVADYILKKFLDEARLLSELSHPAIPKVSDFFNEKHNYYMVMDFIEGKDLYAYVTEKGKGLSEKIVLKWAVDICNVLDYLHSRSQPIIHRDLNPANLILRTKDEKLVLVDFGFARPVTPGSQEQKTAVGTEIYSAPEQCMGYAEIRSDIYSLGATMYFLLTAKQNEMFFADDLPSARPGVSKDTVSIVAKAMNYNLHERFSSAKEMASAITKILSSDDKPKPPMVSILPKEKPFLKAAAQEKKSIVPEEKESLIDKDRIKKEEARQKKKEEVLAKLEESRNPQKEISFKNEVKAEGFFVKIKNFFKRIFAK